MRKLFLYASAALICVALYFLLFTHKPNNKKNKVIISQETKSNKPEIIIKKSNLSVFSQKNLKNCNIQA